MPPQKPLKKPGQQRKAHCGSFLGYFASAVSVTVQLGCDDWCQLTTPSPAEVAARVPYDAQAGSYRLVRSGSVGAEAVIAKLPAVDILVNNVGIFEPRPFAEIPDVDWYRLFEINVMSGVRLSRHYLAAMLERNWAASFSFRANRGFRFRRKWCTTG